MTGGHVPQGYVEAPQSEEDDRGLLPPGDRDLHAPGQGDLRWTSGICACCDDIPICCLGCWCPCVLFGQNVQMLEPGKPWAGPCVVHLLLWGVVTAGCCVLTGGTTVGLLASCVPCYACNYRKAIRTKYNLEEAPCGDVITHVCCHICANCQEHRELIERSGTDHGLPVVAPPAIQTMEDSDSERNSTSPQNELNDFPI